MNLAALIQQSETEREAWKYTSLKTLKTVAFKAPPLPAPQPPALQTDDKPYLTFIDGAWCEEASWLNGLPPIITRGDGPNAYNITLEGLTCLVAFPLELRFITTANAQATEATTKLRIALGESCRLTLIERHSGSEGALQARMIDTSITLNPQAKLVHGKIVHGNAQTAHLACTKVSAAQGAYYDNFTLLRGGRLVRNEIDVTLDGEQAQGTLRGAMLLRGTDHADTTTRLTHRAPYGTSRQLYKAVIGDKARGVFQGQINVAKDAQKTDGHQLSRALLLSDQAEMDAKPELNIEADDVKCSHGSAIGSLDDQALFYLRARGIPEPTARALLIDAFVRDVVDEIQVAELRELVGEEVEGWLKS